MSAGWASETKVVRFGVVIVLGNKDIGTLEYWLCWKDIEAVSDWVWLSDDGKYNLAREAT